MNDRIRLALKSLLNWLNAIGSLVLAYALAYPGAFAELKEMLPTRLQPFAPMAAILWFMLVQAAKMRAIKKAKQPPAK